MRYRIDYTDGHSGFVADRRELLSWIMEADPGSVLDIRKQYKSGVSDSVMEKYVSYLIKNALISAASPIGQITRQHIKSGYAGIVPAALCKESRGNYLELRNRKTSSAQRFLPDSGNVESMAET